MYPFTVWVILSTIFRGFRDILAVFYILTKPLGWPHVANLPFCLHTLQQRSINSVLIIFYQYIMIYVALSPCYVCRDKIGFAIIHVPFKSSPQGNMTWGIDFNVTDIVYARQSIMANASYRDVLCVKLYLWAKFTWIRWRLPVIMLSCWRLRIKLGQVIERGMYLK